MGRHVVCLPPQSVVAMLEFSAISEALNVIGICLVKMTVCLTLLRVLERGRERISKFLWGLLIFIAITHLALAMLFFLHCRPLAALWNPLVHGQCMSTHVTVLAGYVGFAVDVVTDLICAAIPILVIHRLQMNTRTKVALCILMGLGVFTAGCAVAKAITLKGVFADDYTWGFTKPATWAAAEQFVGIIIASVPALRPLFGIIRKKSDDGSGSKRIFSWGGNNVEAGGRERRQQRGKNERPWAPVSHMNGKGESSSAMRSEEAKCTDEGINTDLENGIEGQDPNQGCNIDFLHSWSLPNIADRRSAVFAMPYLDPVKYPD